MSFGFYPDTQFQGGVLKAIPPAPTRILNKCSEGNQKIFFGSYAFVNSAENYKRVISGSLTNGTLFPILSISGSGMIDFFAALSANATTRTHRVKITIDEVVVFDATSSPCDSSDQGILAIGNSYSSSTGSSTLCMLYAQPVYFHRSLLIEYAVDRNESGSTWLYYTYEVY